MPSFRRLYVDGGASALSAAQAGTMFYLAENDGALTGDVAAALNIGAPAMSGLANRLEQAGFLTRQRDEEDGRANRTRLPCARIA